jgi:hypothetical protein
MLTTMTLFGLIALPQVSFAQSSPLIGTWKLNLDKSKYSSGTAPRSLTGTFQQDGQNIRVATQGIDAGEPDDRSADAHLRWAGPSIDGQPLV